MCLLMFFFLMQTLFSVCSYNYDFSLPDYLFSFSFSFVFLSQIIISHIFDAHVSRPTSINLFLRFSCFVLFCFVLFCFVLFCFVLFCFVLIFTEFELKNKITTPCDAFPLNKQIQTHWSAFRLLKKVVWKEVYCRWNPNRFEWVFSQKAFKNFRLKRLTKINSTSVILKFKLCRLFCSVKLVCKFKLHFTL